MERRSAPNDRSWFPWGCVVHPQGNHPPTIRNYTPFQKGIFISWPKEIVVL